MTFPVIFHTSADAPLASRGRSRRRRPRREDLDPRGQALTAREAEICELVALAWSNKEIAVALGLSEQTVKNHLRAAYPKLGVTTRMELMRHWLRPAAEQRGAERRAA